jgi:hypothetical protein
VAWPRGDFQRIGTLERGSRDYAKSQGLAYSNKGIEGVRADPNVLNTVGNVVRRQQGLPQHVSPQMQESYKALHAGIESQYDYLTRPTHQGGLGVSVEVSKEDPYSGPKAARDDVAKNKRLKVLATETAGGENTMMPAAINDKFRAVHDAFGHLATGRDFTRHGEEAAVQHHSQMFPEAAHPALFSELRGQTAGLIRMGEFPENKAYDMPGWANQAQAKLPKRGRKAAEKPPTLF